MHRLLIVVTVVTALVSTGCRLHGKGVARPEDAAVGPPGAPDCTTLDRRFAMLPDEEVRNCGWSCSGSDQDAERVDAAVHALAHQYATCKQYAGLFERVAARDAGPAALAALEAEGQPIEAAFVDYLRSHRGPAFLRTDDPDAAMGGVGRWLIQQHHLSHCQDVVTALDGASAAAHGGAVLYFDKTRCKEALPRLVVALNSASFRARVAACDALGHLGDASVLPTLRQVATSDPFSYGVADDAALAQESAAWDKYNDADEDDEDEQDDALDAAMDASQATETSETAHYPVRRACTDAYRSLARRVAPPPARPDPRGRKPPARARRGHR